MAVDVCTDSRTVQLNKSGRGKRRRRRRRRRGHWRRTLTMGRRTLRKELSIHWKLTRLLI